MVADRPDRGSGRQRGAEIQELDGVGGVGPGIRLTPTLNLRPLVLAGYLRTTGNARTNGPIADLLIESTEGILDNMRLENGYVGGAVELAYDRTATSGLRVRGATRYDLLADIPLKQSDDSLRSNGTFRWQP